jgi:uncharacterized protein (UPF0276 family)
MKFALNYSPQAVECLQNGSIEIDIFKTPDWPWMIIAARRLRPVAVHFGLVAGDGRLAETNWERARTTLDDTSTPYLNLHLEARRADFPGFTAGPLDPQKTERVYNLMRQDVLQAVTHLGPERVIIENVPYRGPEGKVLRPCVEPDLISRLVAETGCGLLFDLSHARITAQAMGMEYPDYIAKLPMPALREMHFTGLEWVEGKLSDHVPAHPDDWLALEWALAQIRAGAWPEPWLLAFEYGGIGEKFAWRSEASVIAEQAPMIRERMFRNS